MAGKKKESAVDAALRIARDVHPDVYERAEAVARIIDPAAFEDGWTIIEPASFKRTHEAKLKYMQAAALSKAHEVLTFLGVNTQTDWYEILTRMAHEGGYAKPAPPDASASRGEPPR